MTFPPDEHHELAQKARRVFEAEVETIDGPTATALRARRREALARTTVRRSPWWWPAGGMVTAALALALWLPRADSPALPAGKPSQTVAANAQTPQVSAAGPAAEALAQAEASTLELDNDADFYLWIASAPAADLPDAMPANSNEQGLTL
jgi:hypothetical protein